MNLSLLLEMALEAMPERRVLGGARDGLSYAAFDARVRAAQVKLAQTPAERTAYLGLNSPSLAVALYASARLGRAFAPLNYRLTDAELARLVARTAPAMLIADDDMAARVPAVEGVTVMTRSAFDALPDWHMTGMINALRLDGSVEGLLHQECLRDLDRPVDAP